MRFCGRVAPENTVGLIEDHDTAGQQGQDLLETLDGLLPAGLVFIDAPLQGMQSPENLFPGPSRLISWGELLFLKPVVQGL